VRAHKRPLESTNQQLPEINGGTLGLADQTAETRESAVGDFNGSHLASA